MNQGSSISMNAHADREIRKRLALAVTLPGFCWPPCGDIWFALLLSFVVDCYCNRSFQCFITDIPLDVAEICDALLAAT